jgi:hypothetical protein
MADPTIAKINYLVAENERKAAEIERMRAVLRAVRYECDDIHDELLTAGTIDERWEKRLGAASQVIYEVLGEPTDHLATRDGIEREAARIRAALAGTAETRHAPESGSAKATRKGDGEASERWRHKKRGTAYEIITREAIIEATETPAVVYRCLADATVWVRPAEEFFDGRFERVNG